MMDETTSSEEHINREILFSIIQDGKKRFSTNSEEDARQKLNEISELLQEELQKIYTIQTEQNGDDIIISGHHPNNITQYTQNFHHLYIIQE